jgi:hypothetical protein
LIPADGRYYSLDAMWFGGDASTDSEIRNVMGSFRFLQPPTAIQPKSAAYQFGYTVGRLGGIAGMIGFIVVMINIISQKRGARSKTPPPLPPNIR